MLASEIKKNVTFVYFPSYYYDKDAKTHNQEKQKRLYIGKLIDGQFIPNKKYFANPKLSRNDVDSLMTSPADLSKVTTHSVGATFLLKSLADKVGLTDDLTSVYGTEIAGQLLSLAMFVTIDSQSALSLYPLWQRRFWVPSKSEMPAQYTSRLLRMIGEDEASLKAFFQARVKHVRTSEYLSYDSTKIASTSKNINDVRWAPSKSGNYQQEISLVVLCEQKVEFPSCSAFFQETFLTSGLFMICSAVGTKSASSRMPPPFSTAVTQAAPTSASFATKMSNSLWDRRLH